VTDKPLTLEEVLGYADFETRNPEDWEKREEEVERHNAHLASLFGGERELGGPGSGHHGHAGRPGQQGGSAGGGSYASFEGKALANMEQTSRTSKGVSDTSSSEAKPALAAEGEELVARTRENYKNALRLAWDEKDKPLESPEQVHALTERVAETVSAGLLKPGQGIYRTHATKNRQTAPELVQKETREMTGELFERLKTNEDPVKTAAWLEQRISVVHPWTDGVGRTSKVLSAFVLARGGRGLPTYPDRGTYYKKIDQLNGGEWEDYYRTLFE
jgi:hypothetical protein